jgi:hypothetical protein
MAAELARAGPVRHGIPDLEGMARAERDIAPMIAFLKAQNADDNSDVV